LDNIERFFLKRKFRNRKDELKNILDIFKASQDIASSLDLHHIQKLLAEAIAREHGSSRSLAILEMDNALETLVTTGIPENLAAPLKEEVLQKGKGKISGNFLRIKVKFPGLPKDAEKYGIAEACLVFIRNAGKITGIVATFNEAGETLPPITSKKRNIIFLLERSEQALRNAEAYNQAKNMLYIDDLTGLFNHRYLDIALERELKRVKRYRSNLALLFMDIDSFKTVNDRHGHLTGSRILSEMGALLKKSVREVDIIIRYGGDEFNIILIEATPETAESVAERIRKNIETHSFHSDSGIDIRITCSIGIACCPEDTMSKTELLEMADKAMYCGKTGGRNSVIKYDEKQFKRNE